MQMSARELEFLAAQEPQEQLRQERPHGRTVRLIEQVTLAPLVQIRSALQGQLHPACILLVLDLERLPYGLPQVIGSLVTVLRACFLADCLTNGRACFLTRFLACFLASVRKYGTPCFRRYGSVAQASVV